MSKDLMKQKKTAKKISISIDKYKGYAQLGGVILFILFGIAVSGILHVTKEPLRQKKIEQRPLMVSATYIEQGEYPIQFSASGLVKARADVNIVPEISGRVVSVNDNVFVGGTFEAGELLFQIEPTDYQLEVKRLQALVAQAQTAYNIEEAESNLALAEWQQINGDKKPPYLVARKPQMEEALATLQSAQAQLDNALLDLERTVFSLPFRGRIMDSNISIGQYVSMGQSYGRSYELEELEIQSSISPMKLSWLLRADAPQIKIKTHYKGQIQSYNGFLKRNASELETSTRMAQIAIGFSENTYLNKQASETLLPGIFAQLDITGPAIANILRIPSNALQKDGRLWLIEGDDNRLRSILPEIIHNDGEFVLVNAFQDTALIALGQISGITDGSQVTYKLDNERTEDK